jgi:hypothetical protein
MSKYGISPSTVILSLQKQFYIPLEMQHTLSHYQLLYWDSEYFKSQIQDGTISHLGTRFLVIYIDPRHEVLQQNQVKLSFRQAQLEYDFPAYVLVKKGNKV